jgi:methyl-accepting chemotaxis protein
VEESSAAAESLSEQAAKLVEAVGVFNLGQGEPVASFVKARTSAKLMAKPTSKPIPKTATRLTTSASATSPKTTPAQPALAGDAWESF